MMTKKESYSLEQLPRKCSLKLEDSNTDQNNVSPDKRTEQTYKAFLALFYLIMQSILLQFTAVIVKALTYISICQLSLTRFVGMFVFVLPLAIIRNKETFGNKKNRLLVTFRALLVANALLFQMAAYRYLQLVEISIIKCTHPFFTAILARIILKEYFGRVQTVTLLITICGVLLSLKLPEKFSSNTRTDFDIYFVLGLIFSMGSVICYALSAVATRKLKDVHFSVLTLYLSLIGAFENGILNATVYPLVSIDCGWHQFLCVALGALAVCVNSFMTLAFQLEPAGIVAVQKTSLEVLASVIFQILFYAEYPDVFVIFGICLVFSSLAVIGVKYWIRSLPDSSKTKQKVKWILT